MLNPAGLAYLDTLGIHVKKHGGRILKTDTPKKTKKFITADYKELQILNNQILKKVWSYYKAPQM